MNKFTIDGKDIGDNYSPYIISEISANHNGSIQNAKDLIQLAKVNGTSAVKLQTYTPDSITINSDHSNFIVDHGAWKGRKLYELYEEAHTPYEWHEELFNYAKELEITIFSSPFDRSAVELLEKLNTPAYKIASFEIVDLDLIRLCASTQKPLIISTGMASIEEIEEAYNEAIKFGSGEISLLYCISGYPTPLKEFNLLNITDMKKRFNCPVGLSDHTIGNIAAYCATALGSNILEKHITLNKDGGGPDDFFSMEPNDLKELSSNLEDIHKSIKEVNYNLTKSEIENRKYRRSLYYIKDIEKGDTVTKDSIKSARPAFGIPPKYSKSIIGKILRKNVKKHDGVNLEDFSD